MSLHTMVPRSTQSLFLRLTEMEKIDLRRASPDRITFLARTTYVCEVTGEKQLTEVQELCVKQMRDYDRTEITVSNFGRIPAIWKF